MINPTERKISLHIPPNYSNWQTIELSNWCAQDVIERNIPGDFVECGVATGNNLAAMCAAGRHGYGFDSFFGIPWAGDKDDQQPGMKFKNKQKIGVLESSGITVHPIEHAHGNMKSFGIENYTLIKGWFQDTVQTFTEEISVLRLDGDLYESTFVCLKHLYPLLSEGGWLILDDINLMGCRRAVEEYFSPNRIEMEMKYGVAYYKKP